MTRGAKRRGWLEWLIGLLAGGAALALYWATLAPAVLSGDGGEFQFVPYLLGVAHATGYPLYVLLGWLWSHLLPLGDVAYRMNLFSALWAALAVALLVPTAGSLLRQTFPSIPVALRHLLAMASAFLLAVTPTFWSQAVIAEVYGLHTFLVVLILYLLLSWGERRQHRQLMFAAACFGFGLAHHRTTLLLLPAILAYIWLTDRRVLRNWRLVAAALLLALAPLLLYLTIPLRAPDTPYLRQPLTPNRELVLYENSWSNLLSFVLGGPFGGSIDLSVDPGQRLSMAWGFLRAEVGWITLALAVVGLVQLALLRSVPRRQRWAMFALTGLVYLGIVGFNLVYTIGDIFVLYIPSYLVIVLWTLVGAGWLISLPGRPSLNLLLVLCFFALPAWQGAAYYDVIDQSDNRHAQTRWQSLLAQPLPPGSILVSDDRDDMMPMWYFQYVDGTRPDLLGLFPLITPEFPTLGHVLDLALSTDRPVFLIKDMPGVGVKVGIEAEGLLWRVVDDHSAVQPAHLSQASLAGALMLTGYDLSPTNPASGETLQVSLFWKPLRPLQNEYQSFIHLLDAAGQRVAQSDHRPGGVYYPTTLWQVGELLRDDHLLDIPADMNEGIYTLLAGMYALSADGSLQPLDQPISLGQVEVISGATPAAIHEPGLLTGTHAARRAVLLAYESLP